MKKFLSLSMLLFISAFMVGCGQDDKKDDTSKKPEEKATPTLVEDSREEKEFEKIKDTLVFANTYSDIDYVITIYFEDEKAVNGVVQMKCKDEETAKNLYSVHINNDEYEEVVLDGTMVAYDYSVKNFAYQDRSKAETTEMFQGQGFNLVK